MASRRCFGRFFGRPSVVEEIKERAELAPFRRVSVSIIRDNLAEAVGSVIHGGQPIILVRRRRPVAVLAAVGDLRRLTQFEHAAEVGEAERNTPEALEEREQRRIKLEGRRAQFVSEIAEIEERVRRLSAEEKLGWQEMFLVPDREVRQRLWDRTWRLRDELASAEDRLSRLKANIWQIDTEIAGLGPRPEEDEPSDEAGEASLPDSP